MNNIQAAVTKEGLRMFPGVIAHPRVVPREGAVISGKFIPGGVSFDFFSPLPLPPLPCPMFMLDSPR